MDMGFTVESANQAFKQAGDLWAALDLLLSSSSTSHGKASKGEKGDTVITDGAEFKDEACLCSTIVLPLAYFLLRVTLNMVLHSPLEVPVGRGSVLAECQAAPPQGAPIDYVSVKVQHLTFYVCCEFALRVFMDSAPLLGRCEIRTPTRNKILSL